MNQHRIVVCAAVYHGAEVLFQLRAPHKSYGANTYFLPGGKVEWGETIADATVRELREELGIIVSPTDVEILKFKEDIREGTHNIMVYVLVRHYLETPRNLDTKNTSEIRWFDVHHTEWTDLPMHEKPDILVLLEDHA